MNFRICANSASERSPGLAERVARHTDMRICAPRGNRSLGALAKGAPFGAPAGGMDTPLAAAQQSIQRSHQEAVAPTEWRMRGFERRTPDFDSEANLGTGGADFPELGLAIHGDK
jgi:hypothetical protein